MWAVIWLLPDLEIVGCLSSLCVRSQDSHRIPVCDTETRLVKWGHSISILAVRSKEWFSYSCHLSKCILSHRYGIYIWDIGTGFQRCFRDKILFEANWPFASGFLGQHLLIVAEYLWKCLYSFSGPRRKSKRCLWPSRMGLSLLSRLA